MRRIRSWSPIGLMCAFVVASAGCRDGERPPGHSGPAVTPVDSAPPPSPAAALAELRREAAQGLLPHAAERDLVLGRCMACHDEHYLIQQRLTPEQWKKTVEKMKGFGAPVTDTDAEAIVGYLSRSFPVDLDPPPPVLAPKPQ